MPQSAIVVVGGDEASRVRTAAALATAGFSGVVPTASVALRAGAPLPELIVVCGSEPAQLVAEARELPVLAEVPILALVPPLPAVASAAALAAGADDVASVPIDVAVIGARVRALLNAAQTARRLRELSSCHQAMHAAQDLLASGGDSPENLREVLLVAVEALGFDRASLIAHVSGSEHAYVVAATDDPDLTQFTLNVVDYPELSEAIRSGTAVLLDDATTAPLTAAVADKLGPLGVRGVAVFPVRWGGTVLGAVQCRRSKVGVEHIVGPRREFADVLSGLLGSLLRHSALFERLRDQTRRISRATYEAERRLRTIDSLKEHFEASADGVAVLDADGRILFLNRTAEAITGFAADGLLGSELVDLVPPVQREPLSSVIRSVLSGTNLEAFDLDLTTTSGDPICVSVTTSTVLSASDAVVLSFRDVTAERALEAELHQTKDFLQRLIDSAVDAVIAADMRGNVILFNPGASRVYGYEPHEVIGRIPVWQLYPPGGAHEVMRQLRAADNGGVGRLEVTRREVLSKSGERIPVNMTGSIIYEDGRESATVGVFADLRERLRIEERLRATQEKLREQEKLAVLAQLAGAAAHSLNQPLQSIMGYAELIEKQSEGDEPYLRAVGVITSEAERMAEIVRQIGKITRYETQDYVGASEIIDLEASTAAEPPELPSPPSDEGEEDTAQFHISDVMNSVEAGVAVEGGETGDTAD